MCVQNHRRKYLTLIHQNIWTLWLSNGFGMNLNLIFVEPVRSTIENRKNCTIERNKITVETSKTAKSSCSTLNWRPFSNYVFFYCFTHYRRAWFSFTVDLLLFYSLFRLRIWHVSSRSTLRTRRLARSQDFSRS